MHKIDVIIIGAGAAGLMCAIEAGKRYRRVLILDHANKAGKKIIMSGGGRCNFTNYYIEPDKFISHNPHFCKSALSRYTQWDFIELVQQHNITFNEKSLGQLFCNNKSKEILDMLLLQCKQVGADIRLNTQIEHIKKTVGNCFTLATSAGSFECQSLVIACGGLSIPTMGASPYGYKIAEQFGIKVWPTRAGLVPFTLTPKDKEQFATLSGVSVNSEVSNARQSFRENILFTHRGLSGPAILQISSYWLPGEEIHINMLPEVDLFAYLKLTQNQYPQKQLNTILSMLLPKRIVEIFLNEFLEKKLHMLTQTELQQIATRINAWLVKPNGTEGYRTAEVTLGGVDCNEISSKTMEAKKVPNLYFIGEVIDVSGWLGGYNFQWAWSSGWAAGQVV